MNEVSVIVPAHGQEPYLEEALASLRDEGADVLVVENGTNLLHESALGVRVIHLPSAGRSAARNAGVAAVSAHYVAFLDADDISLPGRIARQRDALASNPSAVLCFGSVEVLSAESTRLEEESRAERARFEALVRRGPSYEGILVDCPIYTSATIVVRSAFLDVGGYDPEIDAFEDLDLYLRLARAGSLLPLEGLPVACHRRHPGNTTAAALFVGTLRVVEKHLPTATGLSRRLLLQRKVESLWGLGQHTLARHVALAALAAEPALLVRPRFVRRLLLSFAPRLAVRARRG